MGPQSTAVETLLPYLPYYHETFCFNASYIACTNAFQSELFFCPQHTVLVLWNQISGIQAGDHMMEERQSPSPAGSLLDHIPDHVLPALLTHTDCKHFEDFSVRPRKSGIDEDQRRRKKDSQGANL